MKSWCQGLGGTISPYYNDYAKDTSGYMGSGCHIPATSPCLKGGGNAAGANVSTGSTVGDALNLGANLWIIQNVKNPYTAVFAQNFSQGFLTALFKNDTPEARLQREQADEAIRRQQLEAAERARIAEQQRLDALYARLNSQLKLSGISSPLALKTAGSLTDLSLKLSDSSADGGLHMKLGADPSTGPGYGIQGLPGIYVGGPASTPPGVSSGNPGALKLKLGAADPNPAQPPIDAGVPGLPGIYLNNVEPSQAAQVAEAATNLSGNERTLAEDASLLAAQKNPALTAPTDDPFVQDFQEHAQDYNAALQTRQDALQKASEAQGHVQADQTALDYARGQLSSNAATPQQQEALERMNDAKGSDEEAAVAARQVFENTDIHLSIVRENSANSLASLTEPAPVRASPSNGASQPPALSMKLSAPASAQTSTAAPESFTSSPTLPRLSSAAEPALLATPPVGGAPYVESISACVSRFIGAARASHPAPSLEELEKQLESDHLAYERLAETVRGAKEERQDWLNEMTNAAQDVGMNSIDHGVDGLFESTRNGLQEGDIALHSEITATKQEAIELRQSMLETRQAMDTAKGDPARLAQLQSQWDNLTKNGITPLLEKRKALEGQWGTVFTWEKRVFVFNTSRDFGAWVTDMEMPCERQNGEISCQHFRENNPIAAFQKGDTVRDLEGLKLALKFGMHFTPYGGAYDAASTFIDLSYDLTAEIIGYGQLRDSKAHDAEFERAKAALTRRMDQTNAKISCYQKSR
ncbi:MAG: hypothetical protein ACRD51_12590 [Candidatus Acidiferrum sp.]